MDNQNLNQDVQSLYQSQPQAGRDLEAPVTMGEWFVSFLLLLIPCVNIVLMFVWAFSKTEKKSKSNFFKVWLIMMAVGIVLSIIISAVIGFSAFSILNSMY